MKRIWTHILFGVLITSLLIMCGTKTEKIQEKIEMSEIEKMVDAGEFSTAKQVINNRLNSPGTLDEALKQHLLFELDRMDRIKRDFRATPEAVHTYIKEFYPMLSEADIARWESSRALEHKMIDGEKWYFTWAGRNLFRIDSAMIQLWSKLHPAVELTSGSGASLDLDIHNGEVIRTAADSETGFVLPKRIRITHSVALRADVVPAGEIVRCWIPFPRHIPGRQEQIELSETPPQNHTLAPESALQRTIYMEDTVRAGQPLIFSVSYELTAYGFHQSIDVDQVTDVSEREDLAEYLSEDLPHIQFTPVLKSLSQKIVGTESNPYRKAQLLYAWIDENIPWASAREYSTIRCIPEYAISNGHGDCGIQTLLFMTLCRINGIPTKWQSGWELQPPDDSMHDWGMIYFEPFGWVPMDITYGLRQSDDPELKWFYLSGMDSYRIIFNDDFSQAFTPTKTFVRSETVDSQRGELEWAGGNLYFSDWSWDFKWQIKE